ncbi:hypothetical protein SNE40_023601 [Patella caerulea]|uniref:FZ domain-containing protein n=1 Tax=Patella caerulea TaxID=87958 RepID=A0AAN8G7F1_PATCE
MAVKCFVVLSVLNLIPILGLLLMVSSSSIKFREKCEKIRIPICANIYENNLTNLPNLFGINGQEEIESKIIYYLTVVNELKLKYFLCSLYLPPCLLSTSSSLLLPCRSTCHIAREASLHRLSARGLRWPSELQCHNFPTENCLNVTDNGKLHFVEKSLQADRKQWRNDNTPDEVASLEEELGDSNEYSLEIVDERSSDIPRRRYDVVELGHEEYFRGWADVQGVGAANDYCRVIGRGKRKFLSCVLAGSTGQDHYYVSALGFQPGYSNTWFMRDVDNDGRDDYCRCVGKPENSRMSCMKAGEHGFYGSPIQGGSQFSFDLPGSSGCHNKKLNPLFGA